ncbi:MAG TPA: ferredoxin--NADP reductase [Rhodanobacter sp.]|nr:ferredoxin--NADP reductase [Rhodanobacter sp.]
MRDNLAAPAPAPHPHATLAGSTGRVIDVHHWNDTLFSFRTTRDPAFRFTSGQFVMMGLMVDGKPLLRAYSIASASWEEHLEFLSIKVPHGQLTSRLMHLQPGDPILVTHKPTGTLLLTGLNPGKRLYLLATGTGLAPFMSIVRDPDTYERFDHVVLVHGVRRTSDLAYADYLTRELPAHEYLGEMVRGKLIYYPTVTREPFRHQGRIPAAIESGALAAATGLPPLDPAHDRVMLCGSPDMLRDLSALLDARGFHVSPRTREAGDYVLERAFVEK